MLLVMAILAPIAASFLVFFVLLLTLRVNNRLIEVQRQQVEQFGRLRRAIAELRQPPPSTPDDDQVVGVPRIGASEVVLQVGDRVVIVNGPHAGEHGTIMPSPDWLREGVVCVDLAGGQGARYLEVAKLSRLDENGG